MCASEEFKHYDSTNTIFKLLSMYHYKDKFHDRFYDKFI